MSSERQGTPCASLPPVPLERIAGFLRSLSHDLRNTLSVIDLQASYAAQLSDNEGVVAELAMIRNLVGDKAEGLRRLASHLQPSRFEPVTCRASALLEDFRERLAGEFPKETPTVQWSDASGAAEIAVDFVLFRTALTEVLRNAFQWAESGGNIAVSTSVGEGRWVFELRETKSAVSLPPVTWGIEPFVSTRVGGHGLGLYHVRRIVATHRGETIIDHDAARSELITRLAFPLVS
jgi:signal transduction histidine kinase